MLGAGPPDMNQEVYDRIREAVLQGSLLKDEYQLAVERREYETVAAAKSAYYAISTSSMRLMSGMPTPNLRLLKSKCS